MNLRVLTLIVVLAVAYGGRMWLNRDPGTPPSPQLEQLPTLLGNWHTVRDGISPETADLLRADGILLRDYELAPGTRIQLFIAYYSTQHAGESMHSPRNCLPGSGWQPLSRSSFVADMGRGENATLNRFLVERDGEQMLVVYWYQEHERIIANEYSGKMYLLWDSITRKHRDGAIVRVSVPVRDGLTEDQAFAQLKQFVRFAGPKISHVMATP